MSIELDDITSGYNLSKINNNFQKVESYINDKVLARAETGIAGEAKMERDLDMDGHKILNADIDGSTITNDRAVRVSDLNSIPPIPQNDIERRGKVVTFDIATGFPIAVAPASGSAIDVLNQLADTSSDLAGDALVGVKQPLTGAVSRTQHTKNLDEVSVIDFGADPSGALDSTIAFQAALDACSDKLSIVGHGRKLIIPGGQYKISSELFYTWRAGDATKTDADTQRLTIVGDGSGCTFINDVRPAPGANPLFTFDGGLTDPHLRLSIKDFRIHRPSNDRLGWGMLFKNISITDMTNIDIQWFNAGIVFRDCIHIKMDHCQIGANQIGLTASRQTWTNPNVFDLRHVMFAANSVGAVSVADATNFKLDTCSFEGNGSDKTLHNTVQYSGGSNEGGIGLIVHNCYFENNLVLADINIGGSTPETMNFIISANTLQRTSITRTCKHHILLSQLNPAGKHRVHIVDNTFKFLGGYINVVGDSSVTVQSAYSIVKEDGNLYNPQQIPVYAITVADGFNNKVVATAKVTTAPAITTGFNVASVTRPSLGTYVITYKREITDPLVVPTTCAEGVIGLAVVYGYDTTSITVKTTDPSGALSNLVPFNVVVTGIAV